MVVVAEVAGEVAEVPAAEVALVASEEVVLVEEVPAVAGKQGYWKSHNSVSDKDG